MVAEDVPGIVHEHLLDLFFRDPVMNPFEYLNLIIGERIKNGTRRYGWLMLIVVWFVCWLPRSY